MVKSLNQGHTAIKKQSCTFNSVIHLIFIFPLFTFTEYTYTRFSERGNTYILDAILRCSLNYILKESELHQYK